MRYQKVLEETYKRLKVAKELAQIINPSKAILLAGSVAYGPDYSVTPKSDLELICIIENQDILKNKFIENCAAKHLSSGNADIYKKVVSDHEFPVSLIFWKSSFFEKLCNNINFEFGVRFSKEDLSGKEIQLCGLHGQRIPFFRKSIKTKGGYLTNYPVHHIEQGLYYFAGVPVENLLSSPQVLAGDEEYVIKQTHILWSILGERCGQEFGGPDDDPAVRNLLLRQDNMPPSLISSLIERENYYWHLSKSIYKLYK